MIFISCSVNQIDNTHLTPRKDSHRNDLLQSMIQVSIADLPFTFSTFYLVLLASPTSSEEGLYDISHLFGESDRQHSSDTLKRPPRGRFTSIHNPGEWC